MENLLRQREDLLGKLKKIAETCEGLENEENLSVINAELDSIGKNTLELSGSGVDKILQAIKAQRWYFFSNKPKILMDRDTAIIWADLNYFPYDRGEGFLTETNSQNWGNFNDWEFPTPHELWNIVSTSNPIQFTEVDVWANSRKIKGVYYWCVNYNGQFASKNLEFSGETIDISVGRSGRLLPCSHAYVPSDYEINISPSNNFYTENEKLQFTLNVFVQNNLVPKFKDEAITQLYRKIFVEKPALMKKLAEVEAKIAEMQSSQVKLTANFDYRPILAKFDVAAVNKSPIKYFEAILSVTDELLDILSEYEASQAETIAEFLKIALKLNAKLTDNPNLTAEENKLLAERQKFLSQRLELGTDAVKAQILSVKAQAEELSARIDKINSEPNSIRKLAELEAEPRASFELLVENLARIIRDAQRKVDFFAENKNLVASIVNSQSEWSESYKSFKTSLREELAANCREDGIEDEIFAAWYDDWQKKRFAIEQRFLPIVEFALKGNILDSLEVVLKFLADYRDSVDKFYLNERKNIYQKFAFQDGGDLQEKFEVESELYKLSEKLQRDLQKIIFSRDKTEERIFILRWSEPLLNISIDEISNFIREKELDAISEEVLTQFAELRRKNFAAYIADSKSYSDAVQKREKEFNALIFRMRKDLHKK